MNMVLYDAKGNAIEVGGGSSGEIADKSITPEKLSGVVKNVFDLSQNTEENAFIDYERAFVHGVNRYWVGVGDYAGAYFSYLIPVNPGETYYLQNIRLTADDEASAIFYTADKELTTQSGTLVAGGNYITVPATAAYMRVPVHADTVNTVMVLTGTAGPLAVYIPYGYIVPALFGNVGQGGVNWNGLAASAKPHRFYGAKVGCLGDSLTAMGDRWQKRLARSMGFASITNYGASGTTVTSLNGEGESTYRDRAPKMADDLDLIIVMTSSNDNDAPVGKYNPQEGTGTREDATDLSVNDVSTIAGAGVELVNILKAKYPHKDIVFFGHPHTYLANNNLSRWDEPELYKTICNRRCIPFFDTMRNCGMDTKGGSASEESTHYFADLIHLTNAGNDRIADYMAACLRTL